MEEKKEKKYKYWLHHLPGIGDRTIEKLLQAFGSAEEIYRASAVEISGILKKKEQIEGITAAIKNWDMDGEYEKMMKSGIGFYTAEDNEYPRRLKNLIHPPYAVYCLGQLPKDELPSVAVIGARECSRYGVCMAEMFGDAMARAEVQVISGMARGIDGISQQAVLDGGGKTWAVLGCGVDICYPSSNRRLYQEILSSGGGIVSVVPPGTAPVKRLFPERNRIVAGLCDALLVVEAREMSGTWITVDMALEQGKSVYAVPGRLTDRLSDGCNMLIRQGAGIALSPEDLLAELQVLKNRSGKDLPYGQKKGKEENITHGILKYLDFYPKSADQILEEAAYEGGTWTLPEILAQLVDLCLSGKARQIAGSYFVKNGN